jgi:hypothetical protein
MFVSKKHRHALVAMLFSAVVALAAVAAASAQGPSINAGPQAGTVWERGLNEASTHHTSSPNLLYHGGPVMSAPTKAFPIFWGTSWPSSPGDKISGLSTFYGGAGGSSYAGTNTEYADSSGGHPSTSITLGGTATDPSAAVSGAPQTSQILAEVAKVYPNPTANGYYPVYVDQPRGHTRYCAWHSSGTINGTPVTFGFFFKLDGDAGCDPNSPDTSHSQGLNALANVSGHELSEMLTDMNGNAWYDSQGAENADKCAWKFGSQLLKFANGTSWKVQGNWSNAAYDGNRGFTDPSAGFVRGCIDGTNA